MRAQDDDEWNHDDDSSFLEDDFCWDCRLRDCPNCPCIDCYEDNCEECAR